jgi:hypothetical protein
MALLRGYRVESLMAMYLTAGRAVWQNPNQLARGISHSGISHSSRFRYRTTGVETDAWLLQNLIRTSRHVAADFCSRQGIGAHYRRCARPCQGDERCAVMLL